MKNILIIDDEPISIRIIRNYIGDSYKVNAVTDGNAAMKYLSKYKPDGILLDYMMPIYDGAHFFEMLSKNREWSSIPVIVVTGVTDEAKLAAIRETGVKHIVSKPVDKQALLATLAEVVGN